MGTVRSPWDRVQWEDHLPSSSQHFNRCSGSFVHVFRGNKCGLYRLWPLSSQVLRTHLLMVLNFQPSQWNLSPTVQERIEAFQPLNSMQFKWVPAFEEQCEVLNECWHSKNMPERYDKRCNKILMLTNFSDVFIASQKFDTKLQLAGRGQSC